MRSAPSSPKHEHAASACKERRPFARTKNGQRDQSNQAGGDDPGQAASGDQPAVRDSNQAFRGWCRHSLVQAVSDGQEAGSYLSRVDENSTNDGGHRRKAHLDVGHDGCQHGQYQRDHANFQAPHGP